MRTAWQSRQRKADATLFSVIMLAAVANGLLWLYAIPFHKAPDEGAHYQIVRFIRDHGRLPLFHPTELWLIATPTGVVETYATFPPLAYIVAAAGAWLTRDESMWAARYVSLISYLGSVAITFWMGRWLFPRAPSIAFCAAMVVAFLPQFAFTGAYVNNDAFAVLVTSLMLALLTLVWKAPARRWALLGVGIVAGALVTTKYTFYGVAAVGMLVAAALIVLHTPWQRWWQELALLVAGGAAMSLWWFLRNQQLYGEVIPGRVVAGAKAAAGGNDLFVPADHGINLVTLSTATNFWELTLKSFFGGFGFMEIFLDPPFYWVAALLVIVSGVGIALRIRRDGFARSALAPVSVALAVCGATILTTMVVNVYGEYSPQGRYLFPALVPIALCAAAGWHWLANEARCLRWVPGVAVVFMVGVNLVSVFLFVVPRNYGADRERVIVQVDRPSGPEEAGKGVVVAGWSLSEGGFDWRPYAPDVVDRYRRPEPGIDIYVGGPPGRGIFVGTSRYGFRREDVAQFYGGMPLIERVGFWFELPPGTLGPGRYELFACARGSARPAPICSQSRLELL